MTFEPPNEVELQQVVKYLKYHGLEATPGDVAAWATKAAEVFNRRRCEEHQITESQMCRAVIQGIKSAVMALHVHFGDSKRPRIRPHTGPC